MIYNIGGGENLVTFASVPWGSLQPGDNVRLFYNTLPYFVKLAIAGAGTVDAPIVIEGMPGPNGELPIIDGNGAVAPIGSDMRNQPNAIIEVSRGRGASGSAASFITIQGLEIRGARPGNFFTDPEGHALRTYSAQAASVRVGEASNVTIKGCWLHDSCNGIASTVSSRDLMIDGIHLDGNGIAGQGMAHNAYTLGVGTTYQFNIFGALVDGSYGNAIKDRSAGCVIRYNNIQYGNKQLDLVECPINWGKPGYSNTFVYGNLIIDRQQGGNNQIVHFGGDGPQIGRYRPHLYFYNNTVISLRTEFTTLFRTMRFAETVYADNNIFYAPCDVGGETLVVLSGPGTVCMGHNFVGAKSYPSLDMVGPAGPVRDMDGNVLDTVPGFTNFANGDYSLALGSRCIGYIDSSENNVPAAGPLQDAAANYPVLFDPNGNPRTSVNCLGAFERQA